MTEKLTSNQFADRVMALFRPKSDSKPAQSNKPDTAPHNIVALRQSINVSGNSRVRAKRSRGADQANHEMSFEIVNGYGRVECEECDYRWEGSW